jgi:hypothetical protein
MAAYPVTFDIRQQEKYDRTHVFIRIVLFVVVGVLFSFVKPLSSVSGLFYLAVPVAAAILISQKGAAAYLAERENNMATWLRWLFALSAYVSMLTDRLPNQDPKETLRFEITPAGEPSAGAVLLRIILAIPHAIVLALLGIVAGILIIIAAIMVLAQEKYPAGIFDFLRAYERWNARVFGYMAGFAQEYPPFAFDTGPEEGATATVTGVTPMPSPPPSDAESGR